MTIFISTIIPTIGRSSLTHAVESVLQQKLDFAEYEIIVVNDSGKDLPDEEWHKHPKVRIIQTNRRERSVARNAGAAVARGAFFHFLDDDDWIFQGAFSAFWKLTQCKKVAMYYGGYRFVDTQSETLADWHPDEEGNCLIRFMSGEWQPLQASLFDAGVFHSIGGFTPLSMLCGGDEDVDLTRKLSLRHDIVGTQEIVAAIRISRDKSTTNYSNLQEQSRQSREMILNQPGVFSRLYFSARERDSDTPYWCGRLVWIFLTSVLWNLERGYICKGLSRLVYSIVVFFSFSFYWFSPRYWQGATRAHKTKGWLRKGN